MESSRDDKLFARKDPAPHSEFLLQGVKITTGFLQAPEQPMSGRFPEEMKNLLSHFLADILDLH